MHVTRRKSYLLAWFLKSLKQKYTRWCIFFFFPESIQLTFPYHQVVSASHAKGTSRQYLVDQWVKMLLSTINQVELKNNNL